MIGAGLSFLKRRIIRGGTAVSTISARNVFWWEPTVTGGLGARGYFDRDLNVLPVITVFDKFTRR